MVCEVLRHRAWNCLILSSKAKANNLRVSQCAFFRSGVSCWTSEVKEISRSAPWRVLFLGTDEFALQSLKKLNEQYRQNKLLSRLEIVTAYKGKENAVIRYANEQGLTIHSWPLTIALSDFDIGLVVSFGYLIPGQIIRAFPMGMINVHASLLPKWRGAAPIIHAIMNGDTQTGITIMKIMPDKFDIGEILAQAKMDIHPTETMPELYMKLANLGADLLLNTVKKLPAILSQGYKQSDTDATYARKVNAKVSIVKWDEMSAKNVYDLERALTGFLPLRANLEDTTIKISGIRVCEQPPRSTNFPENKPGCVLYCKLKNLLMVQCKGNSWISIDQIIVPGRKRMTGKDFYNGFIAAKKQPWIFFQR